jgi:peptide/nickel transport system substrate-binding protein
MRYSDHRISRRELIALSGAGAVASLLAACGSPQPAVTTPAPTTSGAAKPSTAATQPAAAAATQPVAAGAGGTPKKGGTLKIAILGDPPAIDPVFTTATLTGNISSHIFEGLFARGTDFAPKLGLAEKYEASTDGLTHTIKLRTGVQFHNGKEMDSEDVVASLQRWLEIGARGAFIGKRLDTLTAPDKSTVQMKFKSPTGSLPLYLSRVEMIVVPADVARKAGKDQFKEFVGTGPYKFVEWQHDRLIRFTRFDNYAARSDPPDAWAGKKTANIDELQFIPVSEDAVRSDGVGTGEYHFSDPVPPDSFDAVKANPQLVPYVVKPYYWYVTHFNKKQGPFTDVRMRQAVLKALSCEPIARAGFGRTDFYRLEPGIASRETPWFSEVGADVYNRPNTEEAKRLLQEAGYNGEPIRWMATKEYFWNYNQALPIKSQLEAIGMKVDLQVMDWATLIGRRSKPDQYEVFITGHESYGHPLTQPFLDEKWPGFWSNEQKDKIVSDLIAESDPAKAKQLIDQLQGLVYSDVPFVKLEEGFLLRVGRKELQGYSNPADFYFWNAWMA